MIHTMFYQIEENSSIELTTCERGAGNETAIEGIKGA